MYICHMHSYLYCLPLYSFDCHFLLVTWIILIYISSNDFIVLLQRQSYHVSSRGFLDTPLKYVVLQPHPNWPSYPHKQEGPWHSFRKKSKENPCFMSYFQVSFCYMRGDMFPHKTTEYLKYH